MHPHHNALIPTLTSIIVVMLVTYTLLSHMRTNTKQELEMNQFSNRQPIVIPAGLPQLPQSSNHLKRSLTDDDKSDNTKKQKISLDAKVRSDNGKRSWTLLKPLGKGGCGEVFTAKEDSSDAIVALKIVKDKKQYSSELKVMKLLNDHPYGRGNTPKLICACRKSKALVMEYLSDPLSQLFEKSGFKFSLKTCLMLAINMLKSSKAFYERTGLVHVDIKPSNFCVGPDGRNLYLIDFGYSTNPDVRLPGQTGTPLFMAWTIQTIGNTYPCWLDDLESIGYVIMFLLAGGKKGLPWGALRTHKDIARAKNDLCIKDFCSRLKRTEYEPVADALEIFLFFTRSRVHPFHEYEDFSFLLGLFENVMQGMGYLNDGNYDWVLRKNLDGAK